MSNLSHMCIYCTFTMRALACRCSSYSCACLHSRVCVFEFTRVTRRQLACSFKLLMSGSVVSYVLLRSHFLMQLRDHVHALHTTALPSANIISTIVHVPDPGHDSHYICNSAHSLYTHVNHCTRKVSTVAVLVFLAYCTRECCALGGYSFKIIHVTCFH